jgi:DNA-binding transcriptional LysR family regulator
MDLKEIRYILAIAKYKSISKAAEQLYISQPSLSKYLKNLENNLGVSLFDRVHNQYIPTFIGERYLHYAKKIEAYSLEWDSEYKDLINQSSGRINMAIPIMLGTVLIQPTLHSFYAKYPNVKINLMEEVNFIAEHTFKDHSVDLTIYNAHEYPLNLNYEVLNQEEIVMIVSKQNPLSTLGTPKKGFSYPWVDLSLFKNEKFILLYPDQTTGRIALKHFKNYGIDPDVLLSTRNSEMSIRLALEGVGIAFAPASYFNHMNKDNNSVCFSIGKIKLQTSLIASYMPNRYMPQHTKAYIAMLKAYCKDRS